MNSSILSEGSSVVRAESLCKRVTTSEGELIILSSVDLAIAAGETLAIVGASGSGKSTLLSLLAGLDAPTSGQVHLAGECITDLDEDGRARVRRRNVGFVFQSFHLIGSLTALENVMLPLELDGSRNAVEIAREYMQRVGLSERLHHFPSQLSGGEQQRVAVARAFVTRPGLLFADEPTGNLDAVTGAQVIELLLDLNHENHTTLVLVTHDDALASRCGRVVHLDRGLLSVTAPGDPV